MAELFNLNLDRLMKALGLKANWDRELEDRIIPVIDVTQFIDLFANLTVPTGKIYPGGRLNQVAVPQPPVSVDPTPIIVPVGARWYLRGWQASLITSAVVGARQVGLQIINNAGIVQVIYFDNVTPFQPASTTHQYFFSQPGGQNTFVSGPNFHTIPCAYGDPVELRPGWQVGTKTQGIQAGDSWQANIFLIVEEFADSPQSFIPIPGVTVS